MVVVFREWPARRVLHFPSSAPAESCPRVGHSCPIVATRSWAGVLLLGLAGLAATAVLAIYVMIGRDLARTIDVPGEAVVAGPDLSRLAQEYTTIDLERAIRHGVRPDGTSVIRFKQQFGSR